MYTEAQFKLIELIRTLEEGTGRRRKQQLLNQIESILAELVESSGKKASEVIDAAYKRGSNEVTEQLVLQGFESKALETSLSAIIHVEAVQEITDEVFYRILECNDNMSADAKKRIADIVQRANERSLVEGVSRKRATKDAIAEVLDKGITGMIDKNGREIPADKYMANVIQYHQRKAHVDGGINRSVENGQDLVYVNYVGITCELCAKYQGRVYSISGEDKRFPRLERRPPYHGHCVHSTSVWVEDYHDESDIKEALKESNRPFTDNRPERDIKKYEEGQKKKAEKNDARKQWIRYKARLPELPDLKYFASHKARDTQLYRQWMEDYRTVGKEIKTRGE